VVAVAEGAEREAQRLQPADVVAEAAVPLLQRVAVEEPLLQFLQCPQLRGVILLTPILLM